MSRASQGSWETPALTFSRRSSFSFSSSVASAGADGFTLRRSQSGPPPRLNGWKIEYYVQDIMSPIMKERLAYKYQLIATKQAEAQLDAKSFENDISAAKTCPLLYQWYIHTRYPKAALC